MIGTSRTARRQAAGLASVGGRIRWILQEKGIRKTEFAKALGISANYVYLLTSGRKEAISEPLARLIENVYGYPAQWVLSGEPPAAADALLCSLRSETVNRVRGMDESELQAVAEFIRRLEDGEKGRVQG
ncbi:MAG: helix-turn-helix transcriptional regulator [Oscillospiraceae bacterium]|nr:helix-turn-helix transcriptional regulator [Oscillospiraceae bacterium]